MELHNRYHVADKRLVTDYLLELARKEALKSDVSRAKVSALALDRSGNAVCRSHNVRVYGYARAFTTHAEHNLLLKCRKEIYMVMVYRAIKLGAGTSFPCSLCFLRMCEAGVKQVLFFNGEEWLVGKI